ncbi:uncharacterized protein M6B38_318615 [Iris pallida]|uniref:Core-2/I-branching beta-1,6-N-acetylglucosaminyltransferase family protein n=1 Tax=Iris pallida TaxID=29817 RepID=A0AAX6HD41_IRIPA|nr:uncharacterized protein M6B38_318615 [Iris pallida]
MKGQQQQHQQEEFAPPLLRLLLVFPAINSQLLKLILSGFLLITLGVIGGGIITTSYLNSINPAVLIQLRYNILSTAPPSPSPAAPLNIPPPPTPTPTISSPSPPPPMLAPSPLPPPPTPAPTTTTTTTIPPPPMPHMQGGLMNNVMIEPSMGANMHDMTDEELLRKASSMLRGKGPERRVPPKVAFMFLVRGSLPFAPLWEKFFKGHKGLYSIYVHAQTLHPPPDHTSVFHGTTIPSKAVQWGSMSMMEAERRLLANALLDSSNQRFVLLSEACIPLYNLPSVYSYLMNSTQSFVGMYDIPGPTGRGRYNKRMRPQIEPRQWRKGSQWFEMDRALAAEVVSDGVYFPVFQRHCRPPCYGDEHYLPTFVNARSVGGRNANRSLTWVDWSKGGAHPARFVRQQVNPGMLAWMRNGGTVIGARTTGGTPQCATCSPGSSCPILSTASSCMLLKS